MALRAPRPSYGALVFGAPAPLPTLVRGGDLRVRLTPSARAAAFHPRVTKSEQGRGLGTRSSGGRKRQHFTHAPRGGRERGGEGVRARGREGESRNGSMRVSSFAGQHPLPGRMRGAKPCGGDRGGCSNGMAPTHPRAAIPDSEQAGATRPSESPRSKWLAAQHTPPRRYHRNYH